MRGDNMQTFLLVWGGLGLIGAIIYLIRTGYLWPMIRDQILPGLAVNGSTLGEIVLGFVLAPIMILLFLVVRNLPLWVAAIVLGPIAIPMAVLIDTNRMLRYIRVDVASDSRLESKGVDTNYVVGEVVLRCRKCDHLVLLDTCPKCGSIAYGPNGTSIECRKCNEDVDHWACPSCGEENRVFLSLVRLRPWLVDIF